MLLLSQEIISNYDEQILLKTKKYSYEYQFKTIIPQNKSLTDKYTGILLFNCWILDNFAELSEKRWSQFSLSSLFVNRNTWIEDLNLNFCTRKCNEKFDFMLLKSKNCKIYDFISEHLACSLLYIYTTLHLIKE